MADKRKNIVLRFGIVYILMAVMFVAVIAKILYIQIAEKDKLMELAANQKIADIIVRPKRGNVYASDGRLLASSIPTYYVYMDTRVPALRAKNGELFYAKLDSVSTALSEFFGDKTAAEYKQMLKKGFDEKRAELRLYPKRITYSQLKDLRRLPLFKMGGYRSGLLTKEYVRRVKPFGSLASRTIGDVYPDEVKGGRSGLEGSFDDVLVGTPGVSVRQKVANRYIETPEVPPVNGLDIYATIDIEIQDIAEKALRDTIGQLGAKSATVVVMEVKTGEIKALVNLDLHPVSGNYYEGENHALRDRIEPGSTFKVATLMAVLDGGKVKLTDKFDTGNGVYPVAKSLMKDHNYHKGGYGVLQVDEIIQASSNVGTTMMVQKAFGDNEAAYVEKLWSFGLNDSLPVQMKGIAKPRIKHPKKNKSEWSGTSLAWMSIGYETAMPPIYTLTFYNAIANGGTMVKPMFVKYIKRNEEIVQTFEPEVLRQQICKPSTLADVHQALLGVLEGKYATAKQVRSNIVRIAGKTGTAQISQGLEGYKAGQTRHNVSFCGYFPADAPQYSCIVSITAPQGLPSGGRMAGPIFRKVAEGIMTLRSQRVPETLIVNDSTKVFSPLPKVMAGNSAALRTIFRLLEIPASGNLHGWVKTEKENGKAVQVENLVFNKSIIPDVSGMGAKDAVYLLGNMGLEVKIHGRGRVVAQTPKAGVKLVPGTTVELNLQ
jgi:cell division protein FtsI (penicillin-binding protein 3)